MRTRITDAQIEMVTTPEPKRLPLLGRVFTKVKPPPPDAPLMSLEEVAWRSAMSYPMLMQRVARGDGPRLTRFGRCVGCTPANFNAWISNNTE